VEQKATGIPKFLAGHAMRGGANLAMRSPYAAPGMAALGRQLAEKGDVGDLVYGVAHAQDMPSYADLMPASPANPVGDAAQYEAFVSAYDSPAMEAYPGVAQELSEMLQGWAMGEAPDPQRTALMAYKLSEIPGLDYAQIDPARSENEQ
jgi:hypothetical protein